MNFVQLGRIHCSTTYVYHRPTRPYAARQLLLIAFPVQLTYLQVIDAVYSVGLYGEQTALHHRVITIREIVLSVERLYNHRFVQSLNR